MRKLLILSLIILFLLAVSAFAGENSPKTDNYGIISLLPPLAAITLALIFRQVLPALLIGVVLGSTIYYGWNPLTGTMRMLDRYFIDALIDRSHAAIVLFSMTLGGMVGIITRCGGSNGVADKISRLARTPKTGQLAAWFMGMFIFFDDYASTLIVGNTMRPYTDKLNISREKLSYIVDSTSAPIASIALISTWIGFEMGLIGDAFAKLGIDKSVYVAFIESIPYRFYSVLALLLVPLVALMNRDFGPMLKAEQRARSTGKVLRDCAVPVTEDISTNTMGLTTSAWNAMTPIILVIGMTVVGLYYSGLASAGSDAPIYLVFGSADTFSVLMWSAFAGALAAVIMAVFNSPLKFADTMEAFVSGAKSMMLAMIILLLAWCIGNICKDLGTAQYIANIVRGNIPPWSLPPLTFIIAAGISFATGTSWGTMAILVPIIIPVAFNLIVPENITGAEAVVYVETHWHIMISSIGSVLAGSIFGDHCSPISDTTIMSSMTSGSDHIDHVRTQMPYALLAAVTATIFGDLLSGFGFNPFVSIAICLIILWAALKIFGRKVDAAG